MNVKFKIGIKENLPFSDILEGTWYLCKDTGELYYGDSNNRMLPVNSIVNLYGECDTNSDIQIKTVNINNFILTVGSRLLIKFINTNTVDNPLLNVSETGEKPIYYKGSPISKELLVSGYTYEFVYTGEHYEIIGNFDTIPILSESQGGTGKNNLDDVTVGEAKKLVDEAGSVYSTVTASDSGGSITIDNVSQSEINKITLHNTSSINKNSGTFTIGSSNVSTDGSSNVSLAFQKTSENSVNIVGTGILTDADGNTSIEMIGVGTGNQSNSINIVSAKTSMTDMSQITLSASYSGDFDNPQPSLSVSVSRGVTGDDTKSFNYLDETASDAKYIQKINIVDNLESTDTDKPLSANQGKVLNDIISNYNSTYHIDVNNLTTPEKTTEELQKIYNLISENPNTSVSLSGILLTPIISQSTFKLTGNILSNSILVKTSSGWFEYPTLGEMELEQFILSADLSDGIISNATLDDNYFSVSKNDYWIQIDMQPWTDDYKLALGQKLLEIILAHKETYDYGFPTISLKIRTVRPDDPYTFTMLSVTDANCYVEWPSSGENGKIIINSVVPTSRMFENRPYGMEGVMFYAEYNIKYNETGNPTTDDIEVVSFTFSSLFLPIGEEGIKFFGFLQDGSAQVSLSGDVTGSAKFQNDKALIATTINSIDASAIKSGTIDIARLPQGALERLYDTEDEVSAMSLNVQNGDMIQLLSTNVFYVCVNDTSDEFATKFREFTAGAATSVPWSGVTNKPTTLSGYGITDAMTASAINTALSGYLPLSGGTINGSLNVRNEDGSFIVSKNNDSYLWIKRESSQSSFNNVSSSGGIHGQLALTDDSRLIYTPYGQSSKVVWHSGNFDPTQKVSVTTYKANGTDLNELDITGTYSGEKLTNAPNTGWFFIDHIQYASDSNWKSQFAYSFGLYNNSDEIYYRSCNNNTSTWSGWKTILHSGNSLQTKSLTQSEYNALSTKDSNTLYVIVEG